MILNSNKRIIYSEQTVTVQRLTFESLIFLERATGRASSHWTNRPWFGGQPAKGSRRGFIVVHESSS
jgi:hypothetical protein